ncbi:MAG TPA: hypothetical protein VEH10_00065 [Thermoplasmata archaeon]|nr:hypothetical protein [Thermoplasmata archaeon]
MVGSGPPASPDLPAAFRSARRREIVGFGVTAVGAVVMLATPFVLFTGPLRGSIWLLVALLSFEGVAIGLIWYGLALAERGYRLAELPLAPSDQDEVHRRTRRSWVVWGAGVALFVSGAFVTSAVVPAVGLVMVLAGLGLFFYSFFLYLRALGIERERKAARHSRL